MGERMKEVIKVCVEIAIEYDGRIKGARENVVKSAVKELPIDTISASSVFGVSQIKRGKTYLMEEFK